jgi:hypothetical protein
MLPLNSPAEISSLHGLRFCDSFGQSCSSALHAQLEMSSSLVLSSPTSSDTTSDAQWISRVGRMSWMRRGGVSRGDPLDPAESSPQRCTGRCRKWKHLESCRHWPPTLHFTLSSGERENNHHARRPAAYRTGSDAATRTPWRRILWHVATAVEAHHWQMDHNPTKSLVSRVRLMRLIWLTFFRARFPFA